MNKFYFRSFTQGFIFCLLMLAAASGLSATDQPSVGFVENRGQMSDVTGRPADDVLFRCSTPGLDLYVRESGLTYVFARHEEKINPSSPDGKKIHQYYYETVHLNLVNARLSKQNGTGEDPRPYTSDYYLGFCPDGVKGVKQFSRVVFHNVYPGIDWVLYNSDEHGFKYDFVVRPGADVSLIKLEYVSLYEPRFKTNGDIVVETPLGKITENAPLSYLKETKQEVKSKFIRLSTKKIQKAYRAVFGIALQGNVPMDQLLVIDPQLTWSTFFGGTSIEGTRTIETDASGNVFIAGYTVSSNLPLLNSGGYFQGAVAALTYQFISKFSPVGALLWSTFYSGSGVNTQTDVAGLDIDASGNVFLCGITTTTNFPVQTGSTYFQGTNAGSQDAYLVKFSNNGTRLWATYFGGTSFEVATGLSVDQSGNVFMTGNTQSTNLPMFNGGGYFQVISSLTNPAFVAKFSNNGALLWSTLFDGVQPFAADVAPNGDLYITGTANTSGLILQNPGGGAYFQNSATSLDAAIIRFSNSTNLLWSTYFGGSGFDLGRSIVADKSGNVFIAGMTTSTVFPLQNSGGFFQNTIGNINLTSGDAYLTKFSPAGVLLWSTYYGGNDLENFTTYDNLDVDTCGNLYFAMETRSSNLKTKMACEGGYRDSVLDVASTNSLGDIFVSRFNNNGNLEWATYLGGNGVDIRCPLTVDVNQQLYISGEWILGSQTNNYPTVSGGTGSYLSTTSAGSDDVFINRFTAVPGPLSFSYTPPLCANTPSAAAVGQFLPNGIFGASPGLNINPVTGVITPSASVPGTYTVSYSYTISSCACGISPSASAGVVANTVVILPVPVLTVTGMFSVCAGSAATLTASGASSYTWSPGPQTSTISLTPAVSGVFTVSGSSAGCTAKKDASITVIPVPSLNVSSNSPVCQGATVNLVASGANSYSWTGGAASPNFTAIAMTNTVYIVSGTSNNCTSTLSVPVTVNALPSVSVSGGGTLCAGQSTMLVASGAAAYSWSNSAQTTSLVVLPSATTVYVVTGINNNGCAATASVQVVVSNCVGVEAIFENAGLTVFPNPNNGTFRITAAFELRLVVTNSLGQKIKEITLDRQNNFETEISGLSKGVYFLKPLANSNGNGLQVVVE